MPSIPLPIHPQRRRGLHGLLTAENWPCSRQGRTHGSLATLRHQGPGAEGRQLGGVRGISPSRKQATTLHGPVSFWLLELIARARIPVRGRRGTGRLAPRLLAAWMNCHPLSRRRCMRRPGREQDSTVRPTPLSLLPRRERWTAGRVPKPYGRRLNFPPAVKPAACGASQ